MKTNDGGPAFPVEVTWGDTTQEFGGRQTGHHSGFHTGISLRDYLAAKALQGLVVGVESPHVRTCAELAYDLADAMLEVRADHLNGGE